VGMALIERIAELPTVWHLVFAGGLGCLVFAALLTWVVPKLVDAETPT
jgi:hypothetical protein